MSDVYSVEPIPNRVAYEKPHVGRGYPGTDALHRVQRARNPEQAYLVKANAVTVVSQEFGRSACYSSGGRQQSVSGWRRMPGAYQSHCGWSASMRLSEKRKGCLLSEDGPSRAKRK